MSHFSANDTLSAEIKGINAYLLQKTLKQTAVTGLWGVNQLNAIPMCLLKIA